MAAEVVTPHSLEAERAVLGAVLVDGERFWDIADRLTIADFFREAHSRIYGAMHELAADGRAIDPLTVSERLKERKDLDEVGGPAYVLSLTDGVPHSTNIEHYAAIVRDRADKTRLIKAATKILNDARNSEESARELIDHAERAIFAVASHDVRGDFIEPAQLINAGNAALEALAENKQGTTGVPTGFRDFDEITRGLQPGSLVLIAARPSMGKSAFALNVALHAARHGYSVGLFSLEMSRQEIFMRLVAAEGGVDGHRMQSGLLASSDYAHIAFAIGHIGDSALYVDDSPMVGVLDVRGKARRLKARHGLGLIVLDYLQLIQLPKGAENRNIAMGEASRALKLAARELNVPVVALSQLSRETERRGGEKKPLMSDLRDSGALEQDADLIVFIHRPEVYDATPQNANLAELIIAKQRNGPTGLVRLTWDKQFTRFKDMEYRHS